MNTKRAHFLSTFILAAALLFFAVPVFAQGGGSILLRPDPGVSTSTSESYFIYDAAQPGIVIDDAVLIVNTSSQAMDIVIYPTDAVTASNGGMAFPTGYGETPTRAGAWLELSESEIHLQPGEIRSIPFRFAIPADARGEIAAGIVAQPAVTPQGEGQFAVTVVQRVAVTLLATVQGDEPLRPSMEISELRAAVNGDQQLVVAALHNNGDLGLRPAGSLLVRDSGGQEVYQRDLALSYFLAGDTVEYNIAIDPPLTEGEYTVALRLEYQGGQAERTAALTLTEPDFNGEVVEFPAPAAEQPVSAEAGTSSGLLIGLGGVIALLAVLVIWQTIRLGRVRREE